MATRSKWVLGLWLCCVGGCADDGGGDGTGTDGVMGSSTSSTASPADDSTTVSSASGSTTTGSTDGTAESDSTVGSGSGSTGEPMPDCAVPSWVPTESGTVVAIPALAGAATLQEVVPQPTPFDRPVSAHVEAWNGGVLLRLEGRPYLATHGGGHGDYAGNEINVFGPLCGGPDAEEPAWQVLWGPTPEDQVQLSAPWNYDGNPNISHTRDTMAVLGDSFFRLWQGGPYPGVSGSVDTMRFDLVALQWDPEDTHPDVTADGIRGAVVADEGRGILWVVPDGTARNLLSYDPQAMQYTTHGASYTSRIEITAGMDPSRDELLVWDGRADPRCMLFDLSNPDQDPLSEGFSGSFPPYKSGIEFDPDRDRYVALGNGGVLDVVHELDPETLVWTERTFEVEGAQSPSHDTRGHFGRFRYVPELKGYVFVGGATASVFFYRSA